MVLQRQGLSVVNIENI